MGSSKPLTLFIALVALLALVHATSLTKLPICGSDRSPLILIPKMDLDEFPWIVLLQYRRANSTIGFYCQGSLINSRYVVTAAHCVSSLPTDLALNSIRIGEFDLNKKVDCDKSSGSERCLDPPVDVGIEEIIVHENYSSQNRSYLHDIALIRLAQEVPNTKYVQPVCLPIEENTPFRNITGGHATEAGWFRTEIERLSNTKMKQNLQIVDPILCADLYKSHGFDIQQENHICAKPSEKGRQICGNAGGPLMLKVDGRFHLYGISSFGPRSCGANDMPEVYTNVTNYIAWIESKLK